MLRPPKPFALLARLSHSFSPRLGSVKSEQVRRRDDVDSLAAAGTERGCRAEVSHPWPEWAALMDRLVKRGYMDRSRASGNASKDSNNIRTACLNFAREHSDLIRQFSKREIQIVVGSGCPSLDRKVVNSAKRLRSHVGIDEREMQLYELREEHQLLELQRTIRRQTQETAQGLGASSSEEGRLDLCNFLNFAKNPKCLQCLEPPMRELTPGEWECLSCHYINFRRNMLCLKCNWKRPKVSANGDMVVETPYTRPENSFPSTRLISNRRYTGNHFSRQRTLSEEVNIDIWSSDEDQAEKDNSGDWPKLNEFDDFPIVGGKGVTSQDPLARERWKEAMLRKSKGISESSNENNGELSFAKFCNKELGEGSDDDDVAGWFK